MLQHPDTVEEGAGDGDRGGAAGGGGVVVQDDDLVEGVHHGVRPSWRS